MIISWDIQQNSASLSVLNVFPLSTSSTSCSNRLPNMDCQHPAHHLSKGLQIYWKSVESIGRFEKVNPKCQSLAICRDSRRCVLRNSLWFSKSKLVFLRNTVGNISRCNQGQSFFMLCERGNKRDSGVVGNTNYFTCQDSCSLAEKMLPKLNRTCENWIMVL